MSRAEIGGGVGWSGEGVLTRGISCAKALRQDQVGMEQSGRRDE